MPVDLLLDDGEPTQTRWRVVHPDHERTRWRVVQVGRIQNCWRQDAITALIAPIGRRSAKSKKKRLKNSR